jgi:ketosteroid isomerase-like protein
MNIARTVVCVIATVGAVSLSASGQQAGGSGSMSSAPVDSALKQAVAARANARQSGDADTYGRYVLDDAVITNSQGAVETKAQRMTAIRGVKSAVPPPRISDEKYRVMSDVAVRTWREDGQNDQGRPTAQRWIEVWVKQAGQWKMANVQFTDIAKP